MLQSDTPLIVAIITEGCRIWEKSPVSHPQRFCRFSLLGNTNFHCETAYSRSGINQMWILKNSKELLHHLKSPNFNLITNIKSFDFSTLYTTIAHQKLKIRLATIIKNSFIHKIGNRRYKYLVLGREGPYFVKEHSDSKTKYTEEDIIRILEFLVDNIFVVFAGKVFKQIIGIPMVTNCSPLLADIFLYSYEAEFIQSTAVSYR